MLALITIIHYTTFFYLSSYSFSSMRALSSTQSVHLFTAASLTQLVRERPSGQERMYPEFKELPGRSRRFVLRVISQDLLYHETPVAMSSVVGMNFRRIVMRPHVQRMLHNLAVRSPEQTPSAYPDYHSFSGPRQLSYSLCCAAIVRRSTDQSYPQLLDHTNYHAQVADLSAPLCVLCGFYALLLPRFASFWRENLEPRANLWPETPEPVRVHTHCVCVRVCVCWRVCEPRRYELFVSRWARHFGSELRNKLWVLWVSS